MDINDKLILLIVFIATVSVLAKAIFHQSTEKKGLIIVTLLVLGIVTTATIFVPHLASAIALFTWIVLLFIPNAGYVVIRKAIYQNDFTRAKKWLNYIRPFYPFFNWQEYQDFIDMSEYAAQGKLEQVVAIFERYQHSQSLWGMLLTTQFYRLSWQWEKYLHWIEQHFPDEKSQKQTSYLSFLAYHIRALGEMGRLDEMLICYQRHQKRLYSLASREINDICRLFIFTFCGQTEIVKQLLQQTSLKSLPQEHQLFWQATAQLAANRPIDAQAILEQLTTNPNTIIRHSALRRLEQHRPPVVLTSMEQQQLTDIILAINQEKQFSISAPIAAKKVIVTYLLIGINLVMFSLEIAFGGSQNIKVLYELGSLIPIAVWENGDWWRVVSSTFLHYGYIHLTFNLLALFFLGSFIETRLKIVKYLLVYLTAGIGANCVFLWLQPHNDLTTVVGASGAIMGLLGSIGALVLQGWRTQQAPVARRSLIIIVMIISFQTMIDLSMSEISFTHHISGSLLGLW